MEESLISIVMPVKNASKFLADCLNSIIHQTHTNWELLAVNDNSTDNSFALLTKFSETDNRIKVFNNKSEGIIAALNLAYKNSKGNFITRMDADDVMKLDKLELMQTTLQKNGEGNIALGLVHYFSTKGIGKGYQKYEEWLNKLSLKAENFNEIYKECVIPSPCWMIYRKDFEKCGAFNSNIYPEDYDLAFRFYQNKINCLPANKVLHLWRDYPERTSRTHPNYADNSFIELKLNYFLKLNYIKNHQLVVWGAGKKGKHVAKLLLHKKIPFIWICDNPNKIGKHIYNQKLLDFKKLATIQHSQSIITVANLTAQQEIKEYLLERNLMPMQDYFFFC